MRSKVKKVPARPVSKKRKNPTTFKKFARSSIARFPIKKTVRPEFGKRFTTLVDDVVRLYNPGSKRLAALRKKRLDTEDLARAHNIAFERIRDAVETLASKPSDGIHHANVYDMFDDLVESGQLILSDIAAEEAKAAQGVSRHAASDLTSLKSRVSENIEQLREASDGFFKEVRNTSKPNVEVPYGPTQLLILRAHRYVGNVYGYTPHSGVNVRVGTSLHPNFRSVASQVQLSPKSRIHMTAASRFGKKQFWVATTPNRENVIGQRSLAPKAAMTPRTQNLIASVGEKPLSTFNLSEYDKTIDLE